MVRIVFHDCDGSVTEIDAKPGVSLMQNAKDHDVLGIEAECGGSMVCGTCQVYVADDWYANLPEPTEMEREMVEYTRHPRPSSRLSCQIVVTPEMDGLEVETPVSQR